MRQGTTPEIELTTSIDLTDYSVRVNLVQGDTKLVLEGDRLEKEGMLIKAKLTQEETLAFSNTDVLFIQVDIIDAEGKANRSQIVHTTMEKALNDEVISYGH